MSQSCDENRFVSPLTRVATSGGGAPLRPVSQRAGKTDTLETPLVFTRTEISANPGTTRGGRIITRTGYVPASPSKKIFGLPTCAKAPTQQKNAMNARNQKLEQRRIFTDSPL